MLRELAVQNLALIEDVRVELDGGFCAWTGETGAGKSLLLNAIGLLLGERGSADLIRTGQEELRVVGCFELTRPEQRQAAEAILKLELEEPQLILTRRLTRSGRSTALVNETPVAVATLRKLGEMLVDLHGQRESYSLLQPAYQLELLDSFGKLTDLRIQYQQVAEQLRGLRARHQEITQQLAQRQRELRLIRMEREELTLMKLKPGEKTLLLAERERLIHAQNLARCTTLIASRLADNEGSVLEVIGKLIRESQTWGRIDPRIAGLSQRLESLKPELNDLADTSRDLSENYDADPQRLTELEQRLQTLAGLESKYVKPIEELITYRDGLEARERELLNSEQNQQQLETEMSRQFAQLKIVAAELSRGRHKVAKKLASETRKQLAELQMPHARLEATLTPIDLGDNPLSGELPMDGADHLELMLAANPGEPERPLRKVASGGEMSRTMLALKTVLAAHDPVRTLVVFDEIDANVGGRLGDVLGRKLRRLGQSHQVLCVTHLPQVASYAVQHWSIRKATSGKRTATTITHLAETTKRVEELALMLRGEARTETTLQEAAEMLRTGQSGS